MKITQLEAIPFAIPYTKPLRFASGEVHTAEHVLVRVHTDDGVVGVAEAPPRPFTYGETQVGIVTLIQQVFVCNLLPGYDPRTWEPQMPLPFDPKIPVKAQMAAQKEHRQKYELQITQIEATRQQEGDDLFKFLAHLIAREGQID